MAKKNTDEGWEGNDEAEAAKVATADELNKAPAEEADEPKREVLAKRVRVNFEDEGQELKYVVVEQTTSGRGKIIETPLIDNHQYDEVVVDTDTIVKGGQLISFYQGNPVEIRFAIKSVVNVK